MPQSSTKSSSRTFANKGQPPLRPSRLTRCAAGLATVALAALLVAPPVAAQDGCSGAGRNGQCTEFGTISMDSQRDIRGQPINVEIPIYLNTGYADQGTRWLLFSVRNVTADGSNPVTIELTRFATASGNIVTTRVEHPTANELNLWVDILDTPVQIPISLDVRVGSTERGAFRLETLVMAFDRGYTPVHESSGAEASLFSFSLLGVNKETANVHADGGSLFDGNKLPAPPLAAILGALGAALVLARRRAA